MKSEILRADYARLESRRAQLQADTQSAEHALNLARTALVDDAGDAGAVTAAQATHTALSAAIAELDTKIETIRGQLAAAEAAEKREQVVSELFELARDAERLEAQYMLAQMGLSLEIERLIIASVAPFRALVETRGKFLNRLEEIAPVSRSQPGQYDARRSAEHAELHDVLKEIEAPSADLSAVKKFRGDRKSYIDVIQHAPASSTAFENAATVAFSGALDQSKTR
jgi:hypothetical protein